jgi:hypothetical protein
MINATEAGFERDDSSLIEVSPAGRVCRLATEEDLPEPRELGELPRGSGRDAIHWRAMRRSSTSAGLN